VVSRAVSLSARNLTDALSLSLHLRGWKRTVKRTCATAVESAMSAYRKKVEAKMAEMKVDSARRREEATKESIAKGVDEKAQKRRAALEEQVKGAEEGYQKHSAALAKQKRSIAKQLEAARRNRRRARRAKWAKEGAQKSTCVRKNLLKIDAARERRRLAVSAQASRDMAEADKKAALRRRLHVSKRRLLKQRMANPTADFTAEATKEEETKAAIQTRLSASHHKEAAAKAERDRAVQRERLRAARAKASAEQCMDEGYRTALEAEKKRAVAEQQEKGVRAKMLTRLNAKLQAAVQRHKKRIMSWLKKKAQVAEAALERESARKYVLRRRCLWRPASARTLPGRLPAWLDGRLDWCVAL
jgi:hypothetical protein